MERLVVWKAFVKDDGEVVGMVDSMIFQFNQSGTALDVLLGLFDWLSGSGICFENIRSAADIGVAIPVYILRNCNSS